MAKTATVHARIDPETKRHSEAVLQELGLTPTDAVRLLYRQIAIRKEFPLELWVPNELTAQTLDKTDREKGLESFDSLEDFKKNWE
ncbi:MAG TPA: type II toxin-antitoxin system RelB/DinJ family antitoxin [Oceanipulchritudo sp.]|nr:type II toxin-antitoxin system RelB/DinJ family antitoxin [Oceanipulchritudo sp.]